MVQLTFTPFPEIMRTHNTISDAPLFGNPKDPLNLLTPTQDMHKSGVAHNGETMTKSQHRWGDVFCRSTKAREQRPDYAQVEQRVGCAPDRSKVR